MDLVSPKKRNEIKPCDDQCRVFLVAVGGTPKFTSGGWRAVMRCIFWPRVPSLEWLMVDGTEVMPFASDESLSSLSHLAQTVEI